MQLMKQKTWEKMEGREMEGALWYLSVGVHCWHQLFYHSTMEQNEPLHTLPSSIILRRGKDDERGERQGGERSKCGEGNKG